MSKYITKQRKAFIGYLEHHLDEPLTAHQIADALQDENVSMSAVYRNLSDLETEGKIRRINRSGSREIYYQYTDAAACKACLHLSCKKCGKTFHMSAPSTRMILQRIAENEQFSIDKTDTVIYGVCKDCQN